jgi:hypothetical protein
MPFNQNFYTEYCKKKPRLNILISRGDIKGDMRLMGYTVYLYLSSVIRHVKTVQ